MPMTIDELNANKAGQDKNNISFGGGSSLLGGGGILTANQGQAPKASSGRFTNIQNIISANQGAGQRLAQATTSGVGRVVNQAGQEVDKFGSEIGSKINEEKSRINTGKDEIASVIQAARAPTSGVDQFSMLNDPNKFNQLRQVVTGQSNVADINQQLQNRFSGASTALTQAQQEANQLATETGRFNLLRKTIANPLYSRGMSTLDNVLMSTEGGKTLNQAFQTNTTNIGARGQQLNTQADQFGNELKTTGELAANVSRDLMRQLAEGDQAIEKEIREYEKSVDEERKKISEALNLIRSEQFDKITPEQARLLGLDKLDVNLFDLNLSNYINDPRALTGIQAGELITEQQAARANALRRLMQGEGANLLRKGGTKREDVMGKFNFYQLKRDSERRKEEVLKDIYNSVFGGKMREEGLSEEQINEKFNEWLKLDQTISARGVASKSARGLDFGTAATEGTASLNILDYIKTGNFNPSVTLRELARTVAGDAADNTAARNEGISKLWELLKPFNQKYNLTKKFKYEEPTYGINF
jgi:uncharacterized protein YbjQ (UPF0145 family)